MIAILTFLVGFLSASYFAWRSTEVSAVNDQLDDLKQIEMLAVSYWLGEDPETMAITAHKLRGKLHASGVFRSRFQTVLGKTGTDYLRLEGQLFDLATGGAFQTDGFQPDPETAVSVMRVCNELRALLRTVRRQIYWAH